ncbi:MAG: methyltransferase, partial [Planctomycetota bacterium]|nr:methyltransferase [Planctomycetota bacterium]
MVEPMPVLSPDEQAYLVDGAPAFDRRFIRAMNFHMPEGLAAVADESGAYHLDVAGRPRYEQRYREAFGFYCGLATVRDDAGYFHIDSTGRPAHSRR